MARDNETVFELVERFMPDQHVVLRKCRHGCHRESHPERHVARGSGSCDPPADRL